MLSFLPAPMLGVIGALLHLINITIIALLILIFGTLKYLMPTKKMRHTVSKFVHDLPYGWNLGMSFITWLTTKTQIEVRGKGELSRQGWYFLISNHSSWLDILILEQVFYKRVPMLKFFMKQELIWMLPFGGLACWMLDFPFMKRYSRSYLKKHPEKIGKDVETTRKSCEKFRDHPVTVMNFLEGTRSTEEKRLAQKSPYQHLLKPKAGGFAFVVATLDRYIHQVINVTIIYPEKNTSFWSFLCGRVKKIIVYYEVLPLEVEHRGDYHKDKVFAQSFQGWLNTLWTQKDQLITKTLNENTQP